MSKLDELIAELCPDGVESKPLSEIATITRGGNLQKKDFTESGVPCIHYGQIYTKYGLFTDRTYTFVSESTASKQKKAVPGDIVMAVTSENIEDVCKCVVWLGDEDIAVSGHTAIIHHNQDPKYLAYYFHSSMFFAQKQKLAHGTKVIEVTPDKLNGVRVPVPPLEVQREIVRVLDNFTFLSAELSAELSANDTKKMPLSDVAKVFRGEYITQKGSKIGEIPVILGGQEPAYYIDKANHEGEIVVIARSGVSAGFVSYWNQPIYVTDGFGYEARDGVAIPKYLYYALKRREPELNAMKRGAGVPHVSGEMLGKVELSIPPIPVQERLVNVLDNFESICSDLSIGLPAEIEARKKQYEYYRDLLLTFAETGKTIARQTDRQLGEIADFTYGYTDKAKDTGDARFIRITDIDEYGHLNMSDAKYVTLSSESRKYLLHEGDLLMARTGATYGKTLYVPNEKPAVYASFLIKITPRQDVLCNRYYWHFAQSGLYWNQTNKLVSTGGQPQFNSNALKQVKIAVPTLDEQKRIIELLDRFDGICNDLTSGLPAEIEARQKQYEYYRDKLLTFKEKA